jgi:hypothetical protein
MFKYVRVLCSARVFAVGTVILVLTTVGNVMLGNRTTYRLGIPSVLDDIHNMNICNDEHLKLSGVLVTESSPIWDGAHLQKLLNITKNAHVILQNGQMTSEAWRSFFPGLNATYRRLTKTLIGCFADVAKEHNMTYFLYSGSLIGSFRHHGMVPWDDDVDVIVSTKDQEKLKAAFEALPSLFGTSMTGVRWKLFYNGIPHFRGLNWSFPFLDISFFKSTQQLIFVTDPYEKDTFKYNITDVFPLIQRPFWDMWLPAPRNTRVVLDKTYNIDKCLSNSFSHSKEAFTEVLFSLPCKTMNDYYPYVRRIATKCQGTIEELVFNGNVIHSIVLGTKSNSGVTLWNNQIHIEV